MAKNKTGADSASGPKPSGEKGLMAYVGIVVAVAGIYFMQKAGKDLTGDLDWLWYCSAVAAAIGALMWFLSGKDYAEAVAWLQSGLTAIGIALVFRWAVGEPYRIPSSSMEPTLYGNPNFGQGDRVWVNKFIYGLRVPFMNKRLWYGQAPQRWDIVVFKTVEKDAKHATLVKRIVGLPGERIQIHDGKVYVNGNALELPNFMPKDQYYTDYPPMTYGVLPDPQYSTVPEGCYLVLGDNSGNSRDGRYFGWLPNEHIVGRVACIWWWPSRWRDFTGFSNTPWWRTLVTLLAIWTVIRLFAGRSWAMPRLEGAGIDHYWIGFLTYGLRLPFAGYWLMRWRAPRRGELVLYYPPADTMPPDTLLLGRIAGLPGERVTLSGDTFAVNGTPLPDLEGWTGSALCGPDGDLKYGGKRGRNEVPAGHVFVLGLMPGHPDAAVDVDSRSLGWIPDSHIAGRAQAMWWPPQRWRKIR